MVSDPASDNLISWHKNGKTFIVWDIDKFANNVLGKYFIHRNFSSFHRQLNFYRFTKVNPGDRKCLKFKHPFFTRDDTEKLRLVTKSSNELFNQNEVVDSDSDDDTLSQQISKR